MKKIPQSRAFVQDSKAGQFSNIFMFAVFTFGSPFSFWVFLPPQVTTSFSASCSNIAAAAAAAKSLQLCLTLCDPTDGRLPCPWDSPGKNTGVGCHFLLQCMKVKSEHEVAQSCPTLATPWTAAYQAPPSMGFSRQKYWSGVPLPSPLLSAKEL